MLTWKIPWQFISLSFELRTSALLLSCSLSMLGMAENPAVVETPLTAWQQADQEELLNCRLGTRCCCATEGIWPLGQTIQLLSTLEEMAWVWVDRRERAQSELSTCVNCPSDNILLLLLLSGGGGVTAFTTCWRTGISRAVAPALKLIWSLSARKGKYQPSLEYDDDDEPVKFCLLLLRTWWVLYGLLCSELMIPDQLGSGLGAENDENIVPAFEYKPEWPS